MNDKRTCLYVNTCTNSIYKAGADPGSDWPDQDEDLTLTPDPEPTRKRPDPNPTLKKIQSYLLYDDEKSNPDPTQIL